MAPTTIALGLAASMASVMAFQPASFVSRSKSSLQATVDPNTITKKEYEDICGVEFNGDSLEQRLQRTSYLYPKHVEVIEDIAPIADKMVDDIVSTLQLIESETMKLGRSG